MKPLEAPDRQPCGSREGTDSTMTFAASSCPGRLEGKKSAKKATKKHNCVGKSFEDGTFLFDMPLCSRYVLKGRALLGHDSLVSRRGIIGRGPASCVALRRVISCQICKRLSPVL